jgi:hypothetical protein
MARGDFLDVSGVQAACFVELVAGDGGPCLKQGTKAIEISPSSRTMRLLAFRCETRIIKLWTCEFEG